MPNVTYPLDTTGVSPASQVMNEVHVLTPDINANYRLIVPEFAPFYPDNLSLSYQDAQGNYQPMIKGVHYSLAAIYLSGSRSIGIKTLYGLISIDDNSLSGLIKIDRYQTLGGDWVADANYVREKLATDLFNPRKATWDELTNIQQLFPPTEHAVDMSDTTGYQDLLDKCDDIITAIATAGSTTNQFVTHLLNTDNPHGTTPEKIGLGLVQNLPVATPQQVADLAEVDAYVTLKQVKQILVAGGGGQQGDYVTPTQLTTALADYAPTTALSNYVTTAALGTTLADYVTDAEQAAALGGYVTTSALNTTLTPINSAVGTNTNDIATIQNNMLVSGDLANYVTTTQLSTELNTVVTESELTTTLGNYVTDLELAAVLAGYTPADGGSDPTEAMLYATSFNG